MKHTTMILLLVALLAATIPTAHASAPEDHQITSAVTYLDGNTLMAVTLTSDPDLNAVSHIVVKACLPAYVSSEGCPGEVDTGYDPTTGFTGVKCDNPGGGDFTWTLEFMGRLVPVEANQGAAIKYGPNTVIVPLTVVSCESLGVVFDDGSFTAAALGFDIHLAWATMSEWDNLGFDLYRSSTASFTEAAMIAHVPSPSPGGTTGQFYGYIDEMLQPGQYWYWVVDVPTYGYGHEHGPVSAIVLGPTAVTVASFTAAPGVCRWTRQPVPPSTVRRLRCQCGDNLYSPWRLCLRARR